jgi:hypothetical protein
MSAEPEPKQFDQHTEQVRAYARRHGITNAAAAQRLYKAANAEKWAALRMQDDSLGVVIEVAGITEAAKETE